MRKIFRDFYETFANFEPHEITTEVIELWLRQLKEENDYSDATMFKIKISTNAFFLFLIREGILRSSPIVDKKFDTYQIPQRRKRNILTEEDLKELLASAQQYNPEWLYPILLTHVETAAKTTEILDLKWPAVDLRMGNIRFRARPRTCARTIKITPHLRQTLEKAKKISEFVFTCPYHEPLNQNKFDRLVKNFKLEGNFIKQWTPWDLRYSFAYNFLQTGGTIEALQITMGHHSPKETAKRFEHFLPKVN